LSDQVPVSGEITVRTLKKTKREEEEEEKRGGKRRPTVHFEPIFDMNVYIGSVDLAK
jgi:hypothetical protein